MLTMTLEQLEKIIELLDAAKEASLFGSYSTAVSCIEKAMAELNKFRWETPEQYKMRTGKPWPDYKEVYWRWRYSGVRGYQGGEWNYKSYGSLKEEYPNGIHIGIIDIICSTEAGKPPDDWRLE
jgi:hypothetical protein